MSRFSTRRLAVILTLIIVGIGSICLIYAGVSASTGLAHFDQPVAQWLVDHRTPFLTTLMQVITNGFSPLVLVAAALIGSLAWMRYKKEYWRPSLFVLSLGAAFGISTLIKEMVERVRPPVENMILPLETGHSFPSNHTFGMAVFVLLLGYFIYSRRPSTRTLVICVATAIVSVGLMAISRMYLGYHWLTDVSASVGLALAVLVVVIIIDTIYPATPLARNDSKLL